MFLALRNVLTGFAITTAVVVLSIINPDQTTKGKELPLHLQRIIDTQQDHFPREKGLKYYLRQVLSNPSLFSQS
jgi:hypothetical protein